MTASRGMCMMQMHYFHEISRQVASNHRASEKAHSRKLAYTRSALLSPPGALGYRVRDHPGYLGRSLAAGVAIKRYELLRLATRELRENFLHIASGAMVLGRFRSSTDKEVCPRGVQRAVTGVLCLFANRSRRGKAWDCCYTPGRRER